MEQNKQPDLIPSVIYTISYDGGFDICQGNLSDFTSEEIECFKKVQGVRLKMILRDEHVYASGSPEYIVTNIAWDEEFDQDERLKKIEPHYLTKCQNVYVIMIDA